LTDKQEKMKGIKGGTMANKPRSRLLAGLLSLLQPGLGQIYNGQGRKGLIFIVLPLLLVPFLTAALRNGADAFVLYALLFGSVAFAIFVIVDALINAGRAGEEFEPRRYNRWYVYLAVYLLCIVLRGSVAGYVKNHVVQAYKIPAASMDPTLLVGDMILVDKSAAARAPKRGDLVVFTSPESPKKDFIKRVAAVGGDTVEIRDKALLVNGRPVTETYVIHAEKETIPRDLSPRDNFGPVRVPDGFLFLLGDNRDRSYDSRFFGSVAVAKVLGTVRSIYFSWDTTNRGVRWERIGARPR
jgi:signal peptidase I